MIRRWIGRGTWLVLRAFRKELGWRRRHRRAVHAARHLTPPLRLHLGCGEYHKAGWINIDLTAPGADLALDLREPWPFPDGSVTMIYGEHVLEHFDYPDDAEHVLREAFRVLEVGGRLSLSVPDAEFMLRAYVANDAHVFAVARRHWHNPPFDRTPLHQINYHFRQAGEHRYAYDEATLSDMLERVGFVQIKRRSYDVALDIRVPVLGAALYMDAEKPEVYLPYPRGHD